MCRPLCARRPPPAGVLHDKQTEPELGQLIQRLQAADLDAELDAFQKARAVAQDAAASARRCVFPDSHRRRRSVRAARCALPPTLLKASRVCML